MAFQLPSGPIPFNVQTPDVLGGQQRAATLSGLLSENALRNQLAPLQVQEQQQKVQQAQIATQLQQIQLQDAQALTRYLQSDPNEEVPNSKSPIYDHISTYAGIDPTDPIMTEVRRMGKFGFSGPGLMAQATGMLSRRNEYNKGTEEQQKIVKENYDAWKDEIAPIFNADPKDRSLMVATALPRLQNSTHLSPELDMALQMLRQNPDQAVPLVYNMVAAQEKALGLSKAASAAKKEAQGVIPEGGGLSPEAQQKVAQDVAVAKAIQPLKVQLTREEANARQQAMQGDPKAAGQLLASGALTLAELKTRGTTPKFIEQATLEAQKLKPDYNPADEVIAEQVAKSPASNQFFGSANSLIGKGGTLDQLERLGKNIPQHDWPIINTIDDWQKLARGKGPLAGYAATALGVADDYGKVMGGGNASDNARNSALALFSKAASPEQRAQAVAATRDAVQSQRDARIGNNQFLRRQYGTEVSRGAGAAAGGHVIQVGDKQYQYKGTGDTADLKNYTEVKK